MTRVRLVAVALFAALPLAGCGNKGPLILTPEPQEPPPSLPVASSAPAASSVALPSSTTIAPPAATTTAPPANADGTPGTPR